MGDRELQQRLIERAIEANTPHKLKPHESNILILLSLAKNHPDKPTDDIQEIAVNLLTEMVSDPVVASQALLTLSAMVASADRLVADIVHELSGQKIDLLEILTMSIAALDANHDSE